ncbi:hypothetical protein B0H21DRAFT_732257 [Amylocystis lapponica]|nr:hypothetical protein B0H21DRAFT_732257 [Amylocystis lapponica]
MARFLTSAASTAEKTTPPPYEPVGNPIKLKESFVTLVDNQVEIQKLFRSVSGQLETTAQIGEGHPLCEEWNKLRQRHRKLYRDSQQNARQCASFLQNYAVILVPLAQSTMDPEQKKFMINKFLEAIPAHHDSARQTAKKFNELAKKVEVFQLKVANELRGKAEPSGGFFASLWTGIEELCMSIWQALRGLLTAIVDAFRAMLSRIQTVRLFCGVRVDIEFNRYSSMTPAACEMTSAATSRQVKEDCKELSDRLTVFEEAWHVVRMNCSELLTNVAMANSFTEIPAACDAHLGMAEAAYTPLVECLQAYAAGKSPEY